MARKCWDCGRRLSDSEYRQSDLCMPCAERRMAEELLLDELDEESDASYYIAGPVTMQELREAELFGGWEREIN